MRTKLFYRALVLSWVLWLGGCATSNSSQPQGGGQPQSSPSQPPGSPGPSGTSSGMPSSGGIPGSPSPSRPPRGQSEDAGQDDGDSESGGAGGAVADGESGTDGDSGEAGASKSDDVPLEESEGEMAGSEGSLDGMGVEDAVNDPVLQEALEVFDTVGAERSETGTEPSDVSGAEAGVGSGAESGDEVVLEDSAQSGERSEAGTDTDMARGDGSRPGGRSDTEELATLNRALDRALERFDGAILTERDAMANQDHLEVGGMAPGEGEEEMVAGPGGSGSGAEGMGASSGGPGDSGDGTAPAYPGSQRSGDYRHTASADAIPSDIPDGSDDDVVARQIREAAMSETDPELREKLWDEYRKYKGQ